MWTCQTVPAPLLLPCRGSSPDRWSPAAAAAAAKNRKNGGDFEFGIGDSEDEDVSESDDPEADNRRCSSGAPRQRVRKGELRSQLFSLLHLSLADAAVEMGTNISNFRLLCRTAGIQRWPSNKRSQRRKQIR